MDKEPTDVIEIMGVGRDRQSRSFNLPHEQFCEALGECQCRQITVRTGLHATARSLEEAGDSKRVIATHSKSVNPSLTVFWQQKTPTFRAALDCPEVKAALAKKQIRVIE